MLSEFDVIADYFTHPSPGTLLGVGDDAALLQPAPGMVLAVATDMLVEGRHFFSDADPNQLGHKALAVNLSDMAAMGATPRWATLALALPEIGENWLRKLADGFMTLARRHGVDLIGGDTTRGPLNICVQIIGEVASGKALRRDGARIDDDIWISGTLGDAALALAHLQNRISLQPSEVANCLPALHKPEPRIVLGQRLIGIATAAIDISDGLIADLGHILERSGVGAALDFPALPQSSIMRRYLADAVARNALLAGGDDYELCFTAAPAERSQVAALAKILELPLTRVGRIEAGRDLIVRDENGLPMKVERGGYDHFA